MHNPNVSADAKEHSRQVVEEIERSDAARVQVDSSTKPDVDYNLNEESRVIGGYKATLKSTPFTIFSMGADDTSYFPPLPTNVQIRTWAKRLKKGPNRSWNARMRCKLSHPVVLCSV
jgi:hypothetical protein